MDALAQYLVADSTRPSEVFTPRACAANFTWAGQTWAIKESTSTGPGPNRWHHSSIELGDQGSLKLRVKQNAQGQWECAEVQRVGNTGYGTFTFTTTSSVVPANSNGVLGLFTYQHNTPDEGYEEIDIEYALWGAEPGALGPGSLSVHKPQPQWYREFPVSYTGPITHSFLWAPGYIKWTITRDDTSAVVHSRELWGSQVPNYVDAKMMMDLWLMEGRAPETGELFEVVFSSASWTPLPAGYSPPADPGVPGTRSLTDDFDGPLDTAKWPGASQYGNPRTSGGRLRIPLGLNYHGIQSSPDHALANSAITTEQIRPPAVHSESESEISFVLDDAHDVKIFVVGSSDGGVQVRTKGVNQRVRFTYDPTRHRWLRVRHAGSTLYFEGSADGTTWTDLVPPRPAPSWLISAVGSVRLGGGNWQTKDSSRTVEFANLNPGGR